MRFETIPLVVGGLVAIIGLVILADAWLPEDLTFKTERRRQERSERSLTGEACIGLAVLCVAAALIGRDTWPYETLTVMAGAVLFVTGVVLNRQYLNDRIVQRGKLRRGGAADRERAQRKRDGR